ncbi:MAG: Ig-like domain-containing protein [Gemmatimonadaceae bacterium]
MRLLLVALVVIAGAIACSDLITGPGEAAATRPRSMRITPAELSLAQAETARVTATLHDASGAVTESEPGRTLFYRSSDATIASVDSLSGLVTALTDGTVSVQAVYGALTLGIPVQVLARPRLEVVSGQAQVGEQGDTLAARLVVRALSAAGQPMADTAVTFAVVAGGGQLQQVSTRTDSSGIAQARWELGLALGTQSVDVTSAGLDPVTFTATATPGTSVASVEIGEVVDSLVEVGATWQLSAVAFNKARVELSGAALAWSSADPGVATVDATGLVTAVAAGETEIRATSGAVYDSVIVVVVVVEIPADTGKLSLGADVEHPAGLQVARTLALPAAAAGPTTITLHSLEPAYAVLALDDESRGADTVRVFVPAGATTATYWLQGVEGTVGGITKLVAEAPGFEADTIEITNVQPAAQLTLVGPPTVPAVGGDDPVMLVTVGRNDGGTLVPMAVRAFGVPPEFDVFALNPARAMVLFRATEATTGADNGPTMCAAFELRPRFSATSLPDAAFGRPASLSVARSGVEGMAGFSLASLSDYEVIGGPVAITLTGVGTLPKLSLGPDIRHPAQLHAMYAVTLPASVNEPVTINITSSDVAVALLSDGERKNSSGTEQAEIPVDGGTVAGDYWLKGQEGGSGRMVTIVASAAGYESDTMIVTMLRPAYVLRNVAPATRPTDAGEDPVLVLSVGAQYGDGDFTPMELSPGITPPSFTLQADQPSVGLVQFFASQMVVGADQGPATSATFAMQVGNSQTSDGSFLPASIRVARTGAAGVALVSVASAPAEFDGIFATAGYTFTAPALARMTLPAVIDQPAGLQSRSAGTFAEPIATASTLTLRSLQQAVLLVGPDSVTVGEMQVELPIAAGATSFAFYVHGMEGTIGETSRLVAEMPGFQPETVTVNSVRPAFKLCCARDLVLPASGGPDHDLVLVLGRDSGEGVIDTMALRIGGAEPTFQLEFRAPGILEARFNASDATIGDDQGPAALVTFQLRSGRSATQVANAGLGLPSSLSLHPVAAGVVQLNMWSTSDYVNVDSDATVTVTPVAPPALSLALVNTPVLGVNGTATVRATLPAPAPAGGLTVTLSSDNTNRATVDAPADVLVAAGSTVAEFTVTGVSAGSVTFTAAAPGLDDATLVVTVSTNAISVPVLHNVPFTRTATLPVSLPQPAPAGGITITITSSDPAIVGVQTTTVFIAEGLLSASAQLEGITLGQTTVTAAAQGFATGTSTVRVTAVLDITGGNVSINAGFSVADVTTRLLSAGSVFPAPAGGIPLTFVSRDPAWGAAPAPVSVAPGLNSVATTAAYGGSAATPCATRLVVTSPSFDPDSILITVNPPPTSSLSVTPRLAAGLSRQGTLFLGTPSPAGGTAVTLTSSDPARLVVAPNATTVGVASIQLNVPAGQSSIGFTYAAMEGATGAPTVSLTVDRYAPPPVQVIDIDPLGVEYSGTQSLTVLAGDGGGTVWLGSLTAAGPSQSVINETIIRAGGAAVMVTVASTAPGVAVPVIAGVAGSPQTVTILPGQSRSSMQVRALAAGTTTITATSDDAAAPVRANYPAVITVTQPGSSFSVTPRLAAGLSRQGTMFLGAPAPAGGIVATISSSDPALLVLSTSAAIEGAPSIDVTFVAGASSTTFTYAALEDVTGSATISAAIQGAPPAYSAPAPVAVSIDPLGVEYGGTTSLTMLAGGGNGTVWLGSLTAAGPSQSVINETMVRAGGQPVSVTIASTTPAVLLPFINGVEGSPQTVTILPGQSRVSFQIRQQSAGTSTIVATSDDAGTPVRPNYPATITVTQPVSSINITPRIAAGLSRVGTVFLGAPAPAGGTVMRLTSSDAARLVLSPNAGTVGAASVDLTFAAGASSATFAYAGIEGMTGTVTLTGAVQGTPAPFSDPAPVVVTVDPLGVDATGTTSLTTLGSDGNGTVSLGSLVVNGGQESVINEAVVRAGGLTYTVTLMSTTPAVALPVVGGVAASPRTLTIGPGQSRASYTIRPLTAGTTTIAATAPGAITPVRTGYPATITVSSPSTFLSVGPRLGAGLQAGATAFLGVQAPAGGVTMTLTSSDPTRLLLAPNATTAGAAQITLPIPQFASSAGFVVMALEDVTGNPTITLQAPGFTEATAPVSVEPIGVQWSGNGSLTTLAADGNGTVVVGIITGLAGNRTVTPEQSIRFGGVTRVITLMSSNPSVALPVVGGVAGQGITASIAPGASRATVNVRPLSAGSTIISATGPGLVPAESPTVPQQVTVTTPVQTLSIGSLSQGAGLSQNATLFLQAPIPAGGRTLTVTSSDPSRLLIAPNATSAGVAELTIALNAGASSATFTVMGLGGVTGAASVTTTIAGFRDTTFAFVVVQPAVALDGPAATRSVAQGDLAFRARVGIPQGQDVLLQPVRFGAPSPLEVTLVSSAPAFGTLVVNDVAGSPMSVFIPVGQSQSSSLVAERANFRPVAAGGNTTITATIPGFIQQGQAIRTVTVTP